MDTSGMGVVLDTSIVIAGERREDSVLELLQRVEQRCGTTYAVLSAITAAELTHGIYRAKTDAQREQREHFAEELFHSIAVYPLTFEVARLAGRIHGDQAARGISIQFADLLIGATALHLGFDLLTLNMKHFKAIPALTVITL